MRRAVPLLVLAAWAGPVAAQTVYRCGSVYTHEPCAEGRAIDASDPRSAEQRAQTEAASRRDAKAAATLQQERERRDRTVLRPARLGTAPTAAASRPAAGQPAGNAQKTKPQPARPFEATAPAEPAALKKKKAKPAAGD